MKIIFAVTNDLTYDQRMQRICTSLSKWGYKVELIGRVRSGSVPLSKETYRQTRLKCIFNKGKLFYLEYNVRLFLLLLGRKSDALCAIDLDTITAVYCAGKLNRAKLVYDAHEYFTEVPEVVRRPVVKRTWESVEKRFVPKFNLIYTVSSSLAELFSSKYSVPVSVIRNLPFINESNIQSTSDKDGTTILYQGALNEGRCLESIILSMKDIQAKLLIAGEGDLSDKLRSLVRENHLNDKVEFLGYVKPSDLKRITANATIGINLLENRGMSYYYSLSNKFFDYIQAHVPQVCINFPEYERLNNEYTVAILAKDCSLEEIRFCVNRLLQDKALYLQLQKNCEVCSLILNWEEEEKKLVALYNGLLR